MGEEPQADEARRRAAELEIAKWTSAVERLERVPQRQLDLLRTLEASSSSFLRFLPILAGAGAATWLWFADAASPGRIGAIAATVLILGAGVTWAYAVVSGLQATLSGAASAEVSVGPPQPKPADLDPRGHLQFQLEQHEGLLAAAESNDLVLARQSSLHASTVRTTVVATALLALALVAVVLL